MLDIVTLGDEVLREQVDEITDVNGEIADLAQNMISAMYHGDGVGLAAPQVGLLKSMFVCHVNGDQPRVFINPQIIGTSQELLPYEEGCLSIPGMYGDVIRPATVTVQAVNEQGKPFKLDAEGLLARVVQHEIDHLKGVLFIDHLDDKQRERLLKVYSKKMRK
ncbi:MAG: peptide deformylase [Spirochaetia bacterium]|nr:peptide deformylase [Spirochaetia bacterium]